MKIYFLANGVSFPNISIDACPLFMKFFLASWKPKSNVKNAVIVGSLLNILYPCYNLLSFTGYLENSQKSHILALIRRGGADNEGFFNWILNKKINTKYLVWLPPPQKKTFFLKYQNNFLTTIWYYHTNTWRPVLSELTNFQNLSKNFVQEFSSLKQILWGCGWLKGEGGLIS